MELPASADQLAMVECLRKAGWSGSVQILDDASGDHVRVDGELLSTYLVTRGPMDYYQAVDMLHCIAAQLEALHLRERGMPTLEAEDVIVLGEGWYMLTGLHRAWDLERTVGEWAEQSSLISRVAPLARTGASPGTLGGVNTAPEIRGQIRLPAVCSPKATYYSLGSLLRESLGLSKTLAPLAGSKLYHCIRRCLATSPEERRLFFI